MKISSSAFSAECPVLLLNFPNQICAYLITIYCFSFRHCPKGCISHIKLKEAPKVCLEWGHHTHEYLFRSVVNYDCIYLSTHPRESPNFFKMASHIVVFVLSVTEHRVMSAYWRQRSCSGGKLSRGEWHFGVSECGVCSLGRPDTEWFTGEQPLTKNRGLGFQVAD